jgi:hypothetical protein
MSHCRRDKNTRKYTTKQINNPPAYVYVFLMVSVLPASPPKRPAHLILFELVILIIFDETSDPYRKESNGHLI